MANRGATDDQTLYTIVEYLVLKYSLDLITLRKTKTKITLGKTIWISIMFFSV